MDDLVAIEVEDEREGLSAIVAARIGTPVDLLGPAPAWNEVNLPQSYLQKPTRQGTRNANAASPRRRRRDGAMADFSWRGGALRGPERAPI